MIHGVADQTSASKAAATNTSLSFSDWLRVDETESIKDQISTLQRIFTACSAVALVVSVLGMLNLGLATIEHRSRELSIRRALGVKNSENVGLVIGGAILTGILGALLASAILSCIIFFAIPTVVPPSSAIDRIEFPWSAIGAALLASETTAFISAIAPALLARRVEISSVLRG